MTARWGAHTRIRTKFLQFPPRKEVEPCRWACLWSRSPFSGCATCGWRRIQAAQSRRILRCGALCTVGCGGRIADDASDSAFRSWFRGSCRELLQLLALEGRLTVGRERVFFGRWK